MNSTWKLSSFCTSTPFSPNIYSKFEYWPREDCSKGLLSAVWGAREEELPDLLLTEDTPRKTSIPLCMLEMS
jgi:hypothetical protein